MKGSIKARISAIVKRFGFKASTQVPVNANSSSSSIPNSSSTKAKDYGLVDSRECKLKFDPKKVYTHNEVFINNTSFPIAYIIKTSHPELYITPHIFIIKPHTNKTRVVTIHRMVQDEVPTPLFAEEKIFVDYICLPEDASVEDITSIFHFKGKDYIVEKPKMKVITPVIQETLSEVEERGLRTVTVVTSVYDYN